MDGKRDDEKTGGGAEPQSLPEAVDDLIRYAADQLGLDAEETLRALREGRPLAPPAWLERRRRRARRERLERLVMLLLLLAIGVVHWCAATR